MSRVHYAQNDFDDQKTNKPSKDEGVADRIAKRHNVGGRWNDFDEMEFFDLEEDQTAGFHPPYFIERCYPQ